MVDWRRWDNETLEAQREHSWPFRRWLIRTMLTDWWPELLWLNIKTICRLDFGWDEVQGTAMVLANNYKMLRRAFGKECTYGRNGLG